MGPFGIGQSVTRFEDARLLRGEGRFIHDVHAAGEAYLVLVRSPHAHARIRSIDVAEARAAPGVVGVFTGEDSRRWLVRRRSRFHATPDGSPVLARSPGADGRARALRHPLVAVVADSLPRAKDAAFGCDRVRG